METRPEVIDEATALLDDVDRALGRLSEGTYRSCELCSAPLGEEELAAIPTLRCCDEHRVGLAD